MCCSWLPKVGGSKPRLIRVGRKALLEAVQNKTLLSCLILALTRTWSSLHGDLKYVPEGGGLNAPCAHSPIQPSRVRKALSWKYFESVSYFSYRPDHCNNVGESYFTSWNHTCIVAVVFSKPETNKTMATHSWGSSNMPVSSPLIFMHPSSCIRLS